MTIEYLSLFVSWVDSFLSLPLHHLLYSWHHHFLSKWIRGSSELSPSYSSSLEGYSLNCESLIFSFFHFLFYYYESIFFLCALFPESVEGNHFLLTHIPWMNESHDLGRPFKVLQQSLNLLRLLRHSIEHFILVSSRMRHEGWYDL